MLPTIDKHSPADDEYPGRTIADQDRSPRGLGWEYARRGWDCDRCPYSDPEWTREFMYGFDHYICSDPKVDEAMLRGL